MFRLHKHKSDKLGDTLDFKFSSFQALQVPKGWDRLFVHIISVETGKTLSKSGKGSARNGTCRWTESLTESIPVSEKEIDDCLFKFVVSMGSSRSGILGEATVNLGSYKNAETAVPVSLPLKKCNYGTILLVRIQCLTPRAKPREEQFEEPGSYAEDVIAVDYTDMENKSDVSDSSVARSVGSSSSNHLDSASGTGEHSRELSFSASGSRYSFDSMEGSLDYSLQNNLIGTSNLVGRQDSTGSQNSSSYGSYSFNDSSRSNHSSFNSASRSHLQNQRESLNQVSRTVASSPLRNADSSKDLMEAAEATIEELRAEARMWEQNARRLMIDLEKTRKDLSDQSMHCASLEMQLSESHRECDGSRQKIEQLKILLEESIAKQTTTENLKFQAKEMDNFQKEIEDELKFQKETNADLALQLKKTQESNIELVTILQELEDTIEIQKIEISDLSKIQSKSQKAGKYHLEVQDSEETKPMKKSFAKVTREASCDSGMEGSTVEQELDDLPVGSESEDSRSLELELQQLQDSQKNLEITIHPPERSLENKIHAIEVEQSLKTQTLMDCEAEWREKLAAKDGKITNLEAELFKALNPLDFRNGDDRDLIKEIEVLTQKMEELERDCSELTEENLELALKLKESGKYGALTSPSSNECLGNHSLFTSESEVRKLRSQICKLEEEMSKKEIISQQLSTDCLQIQCADLGKRCADLELQLQASKDKTLYLDSELSKYHARAERQEVEIATLREQLEHYEGMETGVNVGPSDIKLSESQATAEMAKTLSELQEHIQSCLANVKKQQCDPCFPINGECSSAFDKPVISNDTDLFNQKEKAKSILNSFVQLKDLFEAKSALFKNEVHQSKEVRAEVVNSDELRNNLEAYDSGKNTFSTCGPQPESLQMESTPEMTDLEKELLEKISGMDKLNSSNEQEIDALRHSQTELETQISNLQNERWLLEQNLEVTLRESMVTSKCLDDLRKEMTKLSSNRDSQASAKEILERKLSELESGKLEMEVHLSELEKENVQFSERICGLEAQLRYLTNDRESTSEELHNSESSNVSLREEIRRLESELEAQKVDARQKMQDMRKRWLEAQEECGYLKVANPKLQTTAESLIEECSVLQKSNAELRTQKMQLHEHCTILEAELRDSEKYFSNMLKEVEALEGKYILLQQEIASKEQALGIELDSLIQENKKYKEKLAMEENFLNQMHMEKTVEVENLQREVAHLTEQISATHGEKERTASEAVIEVSHLRSGRAMLEASLQELQGKLELSESNLCTLQMESEIKVLGLVQELAASKQNQEVLMADHEKLLELLEDVKSNEEKHKSSVKGLEIKLKASEYARQQVAEETSSLKIQLQKTSLLQDEILDLKRSLNEVKFENQKLEASLQMLSGDYEELKTEKILSMQKISDMQRAVSELEDYKRSKVALEEKLLRLEGDLTAREAIGAQDAELKNELARAKRANSEFQRKIRYLGEEKQECLKKAQSLEEELEQRKASKQDQHSFSDASLPSGSESSDMNSSTPDELNVSQVGTKSNINTGNAPGIGLDSLSKIQLLENELAEALEANDMYKAQLKSLLTEEYKDPLNAPKKLMDEDVVVEGDGYDGKISSLQTELKDLQERYFDMSLKYAEVEAERAKLVLKLKPVNNRRRWFS
ncbi:PREDICTED: centrosome-associated protein CEP250-like isoform X1 [Populus euphratica]|uniref:Centrosome-associated protein CEP250-like isoform X1 n=1 Tax=Populus euphratica TaxID=75702 RepID=A0AAJ6UKV0_POPEU|nr:PREDICTED: centrosome-associated protein CEP250-like isoform X1 [Populus euphratica]